MRGNDVLGIIFANAGDEALSEVTGFRSMASVPFGGGYRLIDFVLSSMVNAGMKKIGVLTNNNYQSLMDHLGSGKPWPGDRPPLRRHAEHEGRRQGHDHYYPQAPRGHGRIRPCGGAS